MHNDIDSFGLRGTTNMWAAVSFSLVTVVTAFVVAGPIVALVMTILVSASLLLASHIMRGQSRTQKAGMLTVLKAQPSTVDLSVLQRKAS
ncbi:MAG: hypothetical protein DLM53_08960 [Candidatus Eremiobacter antarcticus]|nr:hypothetical protein [Candidatus Eremiobacteraeota bacterium]MBC5807598.1 hypothetical protein [Candidatus Eremiobacteraeota bacterium]PZR61350.1 MAG: hypothetical protein DLM53_08960 [Candidatus Eremiobacter sp. RRmetagenome_bin22]